MIAIQKKVRAIRADQKKLLQVRQSRVRKRYLTKLIHRIAIRLRKN